MCYVVGVGVEMQYKEWLDDMEDTDPIMATSSSLTPAVTADSFHFSSLLKPAYLKNAIRGKATAMKEKATTSAQQIKEKATTSAQQMKEKATTSAQQMKEKATTSAHQVQEKMQHARAASISRIQRMGTRNSMNNNNPDEPMSPSSPRTPSRIRRGLSNMFSEEKSNDIKDPTAAAATSMSPRARSISMRGLPRQETATTTTSTTETIETLATTSTTSIEDEHVTSTDTPLDFSLAPVPVVRSSSSSGRRFFGRNQVAPI